MSSSDSAPLLNLPSNLHTGKSTSTSPISDKSGVFVGKHDVLYTEGGGLCGCFSDIGTSCFACCCFPCAFGQAMKDGMDENCFIWCCGAMLPYIGCCIAGYGANKLNTANGGQDSIVKYLVLSALPCTASCHACTIIRGAKNVKAHGTPSITPMQR